MGNVKIDVDKVNEARIAAKEIVKSVETTYDSCERLISYVQAAKWNGKSRESFLAYLEIIRDYHKDLKSAVKKQTKALKNLERYLDEYQNDSEVRKVRNL